MVEFLRFHRDCGPWRHPTDIAKPEIEAFLTHLATDRNVAPKTQNQAFWAILFTISFWRLAKRYHFHGVNCFQSAWQASIMPTRWRSVPSVSLEANPYLALDPHR